MKLTVGDKVRLIQSPYGENEDFQVGDIATVATIDNKDADVPYCIRKDNKEKVWCRPDDIELVTSNADIIYLSGTSGQLEGFRQDWVKAGYNNNGKPITEEGKIIILDFAGEKPCFRGQASGAGIENRCIQLLPNWQALLDRAAKHNNNIAPVKITGEVVKLEGKYVVIGCRKTLSSHTIKETMYHLKSLNDQGAHISGIYTEDGHHISMNVLEELAAWLERK